MRLDSQRKALLVKQAEDEYEGLSVLGLEDMEGMTDLPEDLDGVSELQFEGVRPEFNKKKPAERGPAPKTNEWSIDEEWFAVEPEKASDVVGKSLTYRLGKGLNLRKRFKVLLDGKAVKTGPASGSKTPGPGRVLYNYETGQLLFPPGSEGKTFEVEYFLKGKQGKRATQGAEEEFKAVHSLKKKSQNLWTSLLDHPNTEFVRDHLIPRIEDELEHLKEKASKSKSLDAPPDLTSELMELEHMLYSLDEDDYSFSEDNQDLTIDEDSLFHSLPDGSELVSIRYKDGDKLQRTNEDPSPGTYLLEGDDVIFSEEDLGQQVEISLNLPSNGRELVVSFIKENISPKLESYHSLANLLAEQVYSMQSKAVEDEDELSGIPGLEGGARRLDPDTLRYIQKVRSEASGIEDNLNALAKFHMPKIAKMIQAGDYTYFFKPGKDLNEKRKNSGLWKNRVKPVFEKAGITMVDLFQDALSAFRQGVLEYDYSKRDESRTPDPKDFRIVSNPRVWESVRTVLQERFNQAQLEQTQELEQSIQDSIQIPNGGGKVNHPQITKNIQVQVTGKDGTKFQSGSSLEFTAGPPNNWGGKNTSLINLHGSMSSGQPSPVGATKASTKVSVVGPDGSTFAKAPSVQSVKKADPGEKVFYFSHSGTPSIYLRNEFQGQKFSVSLVGAGAPTTESVLGKDEFVVHHGEGAIEFSPKNGGETVNVQITRTTRTQRQVKPELTRQDDSGEGEVSMDFTEAVEAPDASPEDAWAKGQAEKNVQRLLDAIADVIYDSNETRLTDRQRVLLEGLFGIGMENGQRLSIREMAQEDPFNYDPNDKNFSSQVSKLRNNELPLAKQQLTEILQDKLSSDKRLLSILHSRGFSKFFSSNAKPDRITKYLETMDPDDDRTKRLRTFLGWVLNKAQSELKEDQENILRWKWSLQGDLRRDDPEEETEQLIGGPPVSLEEVAKAEFGIDPTDEAAMNIVRRTYERALEKFERKLEEIISAPGNRDTLRKKDWSKNFLQFYNSNQYKDTAEEFLVSEQARERTKPEPRPEPLYDQMVSVSSDPDTLKLMLKELDEAQKRGRSISTLISDRGDALSKLSTQDLKKQRDLMKAFMDAKKMLPSAESDLASYVDLITDLQQKEDGLKTRRKELRSQIFEEAKNSDDLFAEEVDKARSEGDLEKYKSLFNQARGLASSETREEWKQLRADLKAIPVEKKQLIKDQKEAEQEVSDLKKIIPEYREKLESSPEAQKLQELKVLQEIQNWFHENPERDHGGKYNLGNLFEVKTPERRPYRPPGLQPGEDPDEYRPLQTEMKSRPMVVRDKREVDPRSYVEQMEDIVREHLNLNEEDDITLDMIESALKEAKDAGVVRALGVVRRRLRGDQAVAIPEKEPEGEEARPVREMKSRRRLFDLLFAHSFRIHPDMKSKEIQKEAKKFRDLMVSLKKHVAKGGTVKDFVANPGTSKSKAMEDEADVLGRVLEFLESHAQDLQTGDGNWDLSGMFDIREYEPVETAPDRSPSEESIEALHNAQDLASNEAKTLHGLIKLVESGQRLKDVAKVVRKSPTATELLQRLSLYLKMHPEATADGKFSFEALYSGQHKFPSSEVFDRSRPLMKHMEPLAEGMHLDQTREFKEDGKEDTESAESKQSILAKIQDLLERMAHLIDDGVDLEEMEEHFEELDAADEKPYSMAYLFQVVRNYLSRLNRTKGLQNMAKNYGLDMLFPEGAPLADPSDVEETTPVPATEVEEEVEEIADDSDETPMFRRMVEEVGFSDSQAQIAKQVLESTQLRHEDSGEHIKDLVKPLLQKNHLKEIILKSFKFISENREEFQRGEFFDLSPLTGVPFSEPDVSEEEETVEEAQEAPPAPESAEESLPTSMLSLREKLTEDSSIKEKTDLLKKVLDRGVSPDDVYQAVMTSKLPPDTIFAMQDVLSDSGWQSDDPFASPDLPEPKEHGIRSEDLPAAQPIEGNFFDQVLARAVSFQKKTRKPLLNVIDFVKEIESDIGIERAHEALLELAKQKRIELRPRSGVGDLSKSDLKYAIREFGGVLVTHARILDDKVQPTEPAASKPVPESTTQKPDETSKRGRLSKDLTALNVGDSGRATILRSADLSAGEESDLTEYFPGWDGVSSYGEAKTLASRSATNIKSANPKVQRRIKKAWKKYAKAWVAFLRALPEQQPAPQEKPQAAPAAPQQEVQPAQPVKPVQQPAQQPQATQEQAAALLRKSVEIILAKNWDADTFEVYLDKRRPEMIPLYQQIKPKIQSIVEELSKEDDPFEDL